MFYLNFTSYGFRSKHALTCSKWALNHGLPLWSSQTWRLSVRLPHSAPCSAYCSRPAERGSSPSAESLSLLTPACNRGTEWRLWPFVFLIGSLECLHFTLWETTVSWKMHVLPREHWGYSSTGMKQHHLQLLNLNKWINQTFKSRANAEIVCLFCYTSWVCWQSNLTKKSIVFFT